MTTPRFHVGIASTALPGPQTLEQLDVLELRLRGSLPATADARRWREAAPAELAVALRAPPDLFTDAGGRRPTAPRLADDPRTRRRWKDIAELARATSASWVIVPSPPWFGSSDDHVDQLSRFFDWAHRDRRHLGWEPRSPTWSDELLARLCRELSLSHVVDPLEREPARGRPPYYRLRGRTGRGHRHSDAELAALRTACGMTRPMCSTDACFCVFANDDRRTDARRFAALVRAGG